MLTKKEKFNNLLNKDLVFLDGAMGTMVFNSKVEYEGPIETVLIENPDVIQKIHEKYIDAGSDIIYSFTFGCNGYKFKDSKYSVEQVIKQGIKVAKKAAKEKLVALDIGPIGTLLEPTGTLSFEQAYEYFKEIIQAGSEADLIVFETMSDLYELKAGVLAAIENSELPIMTSMTFEQDRRSFTGCSIESYTTLMDNLEVAAIGVNCSLGPIELKPIIKQICNSTDKPILVKANAGLPDPATGEYLLDAKAFLKATKKYMKYGVKLVGGCCGTTDEYIRLLKENLISYTKQKIKKESVVCSGINAVKIDTVRVIGERINPTGKKRFRQALKEKDYNYILNMAIAQVEAGADILDVNVGILNVDESELMKIVVKKIQSVVSVPLQIDSSNLDAIEAGLRIYNGKAIVNSVNAEEEKMEPILKLVKKYGASVVGLTIDDEGIPTTAKKRVEIAKKILDKALELGIKKEDVYIDCLTLTIASAPEQVFETLNAMKTIHDELGLQLVLGVSNISFGLPNRVLMNQTFLISAINHGLTLPIINPNNKELIGCIDAYRAMSSYDSNCESYIQKYNNVEKTETVKTNMDIKTAVYKGLETEVQNLVKEKLKTTPTMEIIDEYLIPALDLVGNDYEANKLFLPQLIKSAQAASAGFDYIKSLLSSEQNISKGTLIMATVKGDVHDIGKNIVKVILENYGYKVIDLGKDVAIDQIVKTAIEKDVPLVGLSALMTTTSVNIKLTVKALKEANYKGKVMIGGAVVTADFAKEIGANYYAKDAKDAVKIAEEVFNG